MKENNIKWKKYMFHTIKYNQMRLNLPITSCTMLRKLPHSKQ